MLAVLCLIPTLVSFCEATCTFPSNLRGLWKTTTLGTLDFGSDYVAKLPFGTSQWNSTCFENIGSDYVIRSERFQFSQTEYYYGYVCLNLQPAPGSTATFLYYWITSGFNSDYIPVNENSTPPKFSDVCNNRTLMSVPGAYSVMMKENSVDAAKITCPEEFSYDFNVTMDNCPNNASLDVCSDTTLLLFNYTTCGGSTFTGEEKYSCLYSTVDGNLRYVSLYRNDGNFYCFIAGSGNDSVDVTRMPGNCDLTQTATSVPSPGVYMSLTPTAKCVITTTTSTTAATTTQKSVAAGQGPVELWMLLLGYIVAIVRWSN